MGHLQVILFLYSQSGSSTQSQLTSTGVGMLFSAGTFLYVATVHILPEVSSSKAVQMTPDLQQQEGAEAHQQQPLGLSLSITLIIGIGLPLVLALGLKDDWVSSQCQHVPVYLSPAPAGEEGQIYDPHWTPAVWIETKNRDSGCMLPRRQGHAKNAEPSACQCAIIKQGLEKDGWQEVQKLMRWFPITEDSDLKAQIRVIYFYTAIIILF